MHNSQHPHASQTIIDLHDKVQAALAGKFGDSLLKSQIDYDFPVFIVAKSAIHEVLAFLKTDKDLGFTFLTTLCGAHFPEKEENEFMTRKVF